MGKGPNDLSPEELAALEQRIKNWQEKTLASAPKRLRALGVVLRKSVLMNDLRELRRFLRRHKLWSPTMVDDRRLITFRDQLIVQRFDMRDLEPEARTRLRQLNLSDQDETKMTPDYRLGRQAGLDLRCRDCRWFVTAPNDESEDGYKSCVSMGTKGTDTACYGFTRPPN